LFAVEYALAQTLLSWGVEPDAAIGHSLGEYVAACLAGVFTAADAVRLVVLRGRLMQDCAPGRMLAVALAEDELRDVLPDGLDLSAVNGPAACVVGGPAELVRLFADRLRARHVGAVEVPTSHAFHSASMQPVLARFRAAVQAVPLATPSTPYVSNVTGGWISAEQATDPEYWVRHLRQTVRFAEGVRLLGADPGRLYLEVGPGRTLSRLLGPSAFPTLDRDRPDETAYLLEQLGTAWTVGLDADWSQLVGRPARRIALPTYPFTPTRHWIDPDSVPAVDPAVDLALEPAVGPALDPAVDPVTPTADRPVSATQRGIAELWQELLGVDAPGVHDSFFALGGHSLLAVQLAGRLGDRFQVTVPLRVLLEHPTVAGLAAFIDSTRADAPTHQAAGATTWPASGPPAASGRPTVVGRASAESRAPDGSPATDRMRFSLMYFSGEDDDDASRTADRYRSLLAAVEFADRSGFEAVWFPERHFHPFGGPYPSPSVLAAAVAVRTERIGLRAGSVVLPLRHPVRVAEEWSMVDNLSNGRVGLSVASGWQRDDFVLATEPGSYDRRRELMIERLKTVERLWSGETVTLPRDDGAPTPVRIFPRPRQPRLPIWFTSSGNPATWIAAGARGANVLTALFAQNLDALRENIARYRAARTEHGHDPAAGRVTLSLHAYIGDDLDEVRRIVREPLRDYLRSHLELYRGMAAASGITLADGDQEALLDFAFERYFTGSALLGTPEIAAAMVDRLRAIGVDEIACQLDFGLPEPEAERGLHRLAELNRQHVERAGQPAVGRPRSPIVTLRQEGDGVPFFCVHPVDGSVFGFRELAEAIGTERPFYAVQAPGFEGEQEPVTDLVTLARRYTHAVREVQPQGPYLLGGWSFGGVVATEMARMLLASGSAVAGVVMLDSRVPDQMAQQLSAITEFLDRWEPVLRSGPDGPAWVEEALRSGTVPAGLAVGDVPAMVEQLRAVDEFPVGRILLMDRHARRLTRAHITAMSNYRPGRLPDVAVTLVRAQQQPDVFGNDPLLGWGPLAGSRFAVHVADGDHYTMLRRPLVQSLADWLRGTLASAAATVA
jgi:natural product biosynthesis luciferase-like monooxygenase protein